MDVVLSEYLNKSHNFTNFIFMTSSLRYSMFNMKSSCGLQIPFTPALCRLAREKERFREGSYFFVIWPRVVVIMIVNVTFLKAGYLVCVTVKWLL